MESEASQASADEKDAKPVSIAIIGAGSSGLACARELTSCPRLAKEVSVTIFEQREDLGGVWNPDGQSPLYPNLRTNLPMECMGIPEFPYDNQSHSYPTWEQVFQYLNEYADHFDLRKLIRYGQKIKSIRPVSGCTQWEINNEERFDVVVSAVGIFNTPYVPEFPPDVFAFEGTIRHATSYKSPEEFAGQAVLVVGRGGSGTDLAMDLSAVADEVVWCHSSFVQSCEKGEKEDKDVTKAAPNEFPQNVTTVGALQSISKDGMAVFTGTAGTTIEKKIDVLMWATGYKYDFPFFPDCPEIQPKQGPRHNRKDSSAWNSMHGNMWHKDYWRSLFFVGVARNNLPFGMHSLQARCIAATLRGEILLEDIQQLPPLAADFFGCQWLYYQELHYLAQGMRDELRALIAEVHRRKDLWVDGRVDGVEGLPLQDWLYRMRDLYHDTKGRGALEPDTYRRIDYKLDSVDVHNSQASEGAECSTASNTDSRVVASGNGPVEGNGAPYPTEESQRIQTGVSLWSTEAIAWKAVEYISSS